MYRGLIKVAGANHVNVWKIGLTKISVAENARLEPSAMAIKNDNTNLAVLYIDPWPCDNTNKTERLTLRIFKTIDGSH